MRAFLLILCLGQFVVPAAWAAVGIGSGRERDVLQLLDPYRDEGPVGAATLTGIAIGRDRVLVRLRDAAGQTAEVLLLPQEPPAPRAFAIQTPPAPTPALRDAQDKLRVAVTQHDDGTFFARGPQVTSIRPSARSGFLRGLAALLWAALAVVIAVHLATARWRWRKLLATLALLTMAMQARTSMPLTPLHANGHAFEDAAVALSVPQTEPSRERALAEYGATWLEFQRQTVRFWDASWDGLGRWSAAVSSLAVAIAFLAALASGGGWPGALVGALVLAWAPVAARVGHSESNLVVAQLLVAIALWLAADDRLLRRIGVVVALLLLGLGHPLGPGYALGAALAAWALLPPSARLPATAMPQLEAAQTLGLRAQRLWRDLHAGWLLILLGTVALGLVVNLVGNAELLARRASATHQVVPLPANPAQYLLWLDPDQAPVSFLVLVLLGTWAFLRQRARPYGRNADQPQLAGREGIRAWALPVGALVTCVVGLVVVACVSDALRYQAVLAPVLLVLASHASRALPAPPWRLPVRLLGIIAGSLTLLELSRPMSGRSALDGQGQAWQGFLAAMAHLSGDVWLVQSDRSAITAQAGQGAPQGRRVVVEAPQGRLHEAGPTLRAITTTDVRTACSEGRALPAPLLVWLPADCEVEELPGVPSACRDLAELAASHADRAGGDVIWLQGRYRHGISGEFHAHRGRLGQWRLLDVACRQ